MTWRSRTATLFLVLASSLTALAIAEGMLRLLAWGHVRPVLEVARRDPMAVKVRPNGVFGYRQRPGAVFPYSNGRFATANVDGFRGPSVVRPKPAGSRRVVLLGESTTHGWGVNDDQTIDAYLRVELQAAAPGLQIDVVNLAFDGYDAYQIWQRLITDGVALQPDAIVLNTGINDVHHSLLTPPMSDPDPRTLNWEADVGRLRDEAAHGGPRLWTRAKHLLYLARLPGLLRASLSARSVATVPAQPHLEAADNFELNVSRVMDVAHQLGVPIILSTPPSVLMSEGAPANMRPRNYWIGSDRAATQAYRDTLAGRLVALASRRSAAGQAVTYVAHQLSPDQFLDDCHLTPEGNRQMASDFGALLFPLVTRR